MTERVIGLGTLLKIGDGAVPEAYLYFLSDFFSHKMIFELNVWSFFNLHNLIGNSIEGFQRPNRRLAGKKAA
jgi:hypothetical protein